MEDNWEGQVGEILGKIRANDQIHAEYAKQVENQLIKVQRTSSDAIASEIERKFNARLYYVHKKLD